MVSIFTYRNERKLFVVVATVVVAALVALVQIDAARSGRPSPISVALSTAATTVQVGLTGVFQAVRGGAAGAMAIPRLQSDNQELRAEAHALKQQNHALAEALARAPGALAAAQVLARHDGLEAQVVGYDPESAARTIALDRGAHAGIVRDAGVVTDEGVVGRVVAVDPFASFVLLVTDAGSKLPAVVQRGRWWGIAVGVPQDGTIALEYVSQDARLRIGDAVVTGAGRSFAAGFALGKIAKIYRPEGALYQTAVLTPAVRLGRLGAVVVMPPHAAAAGASAANSGA
ncbi:MAG: rod shape-determining protein MreC [Candidatus Baltobacteraceae bacterium]